MLSVDLTVHSYYTWMLLSTMFKRRTVSLKVLFLLTRQECTNSYLNRVIPVLLQSALGSFTDTSTATHDMLLH